MLWKEKRSEGEDQFICEMADRTKQNGDYSSTLGYDIQRAPFSRICRMSLRDSSLKHRCLMKNPWLHRSIGATFYNAHEYLDVSAYNLRRSINKACNVWACLKLTPMLTLSSTQLIHTVETCVVAC